MMTFFTIFYFSPSFYSFIIIIIMQPSIDLLSSDMQLLSPSLSCLFFTIVSFYLPLLL